MKLMDIDQEHLGIPDTVYDAEIRLPAGEFARIIRDLKELGESVKIEVSKDGVRFSADGDIGSASVTLKPTSAKVDEEEDDEDEEEKEEEEEDEEDEEPKDEEEEEVPATAPVDGDADMEPKPEDDDDLTIVEPVRADGDVRSCCFLLSSSRLILISAPLPFRTGRSRRSRQQARNQIDWQCRSRR